MREAEDNDMLSMLSLSKPLHACTGLCLPIVRLIIIIISIIMMIM